MPVVIDDVEYMDRAELAAYLGVQPATVSSWVSRKKMPAPTARIGRSPLFRVDEIKEWEANRRGKGWRSDQ